MNLQENIRRILKEDKKTKSTNKEFSKYKDSKFNSLRDYTLQDIVDDWDSLSDHKNENIKTIKHFVNNPDKITDLVYDEKGLEDGYHRLIAAKILKKPRFSYRLVENLQENIRRILREETNQNDGISVLLNEFGLYYVINYMGIKYDDVISKVGKLPREVIIQFLKDVVDDEKYYSPDGVNLSSGPLFINVLVQPYYYYYWGDNEEWSFDFMRKDPDDDTLMVDFAQWYDGGADFETIDEYDLHDNVLEILVSELSEKIQQNKM